jgi:hypothetical protein
MRWAKVLCLSWIAIVVMEKPQFAGTRISGAAAAHVFGGQQAIGASCQPFDTCDFFPQSVCANGQGPCADRKNITVYSGNRNACSTNGNPPRDCATSGSYICRTIQHCIQQGANCVVNSSAGTDTLNFPEKCEDVPQGEG